MGTLPNTVSFDAPGVSSAEYPTETFLVDEDTGGISRTGGGLEAMKQAIRIVLNIERYAYQIYSPNFGRELNDLVGKPPEYVASMLKRRIGEAFSNDSRILSVDNFFFDTSEPGTIVCTFQVNTAYGMVPGEVKV